MPERKQETDKRLLRAVAAGDTAALKQLYLSYRPRLRLFLLRVGCREEEIDEACNETFLVVWDKASSFRGDSRVATWILGIARRKGLKLVERRSREQGRFDGRDEDSLAQPGIRAESRQELRQWLEVGLASLPPEQQQVLELAFMDGLSCREISVVMDCPENTVKTRMFHARRKLREILPAEARPRTEATRK